MLEESALNHYCHGKSNISFNPTGFSLLLIVGLSHDAIDFRRVNSGVRRLRH
jgi:hypothetical protein